MREMGKRTPNEKYAQIISLLFPSASKTDKLFEAENARLKVTVQKATGRIEQL